VAGRNHDVILVATVMRALVSGLWLCLLFCLTGGAHAEPAIATFPRVELKDLDGHTRTLSGGGAMVVCWEDDKSSKQKQDAHAVVGRYSDNPSNRSVFELIVIADLERWDFWPARGHAVASIKKTQTKESTPVWIDWKGALRKAAGLRKAESAFFVVGADGRVRWQAQGKLDEMQRKALDAAIAELGATPAPGR
jgi:predicted transcriptional regulator